MVLAALVVLAACPIAGNPTRYGYVCDRGVASPLRDAATEGIEHCIRCNVGYTLINETCIEVADLNINLSNSCPLTAKTPCLVQLPDLVFDSSERFSGHVPDQSEKHLVQVDGSSIFPYAANMSYRILSGNPTYEYRQATRNGMTRSIHLSGYRINSEGKLYTKDVWLLGRNSAVYDDTDERYIFRQKSGTYYALWIPWRAQCPILDSGIQDCTNLHAYRYDYTFNRTDIDILIIEVENTDTGETREVTIEINPNADAFPRPVSPPGEPITPAPSTGLSCFSSSSEALRNCTTNLPLVVHENSERFWWLDQSDNYLVRVDAENAFPTTNRLSYTIISGNPTYTAESTLGSGVKQIVNLSGYGINSEGKIYPKDVWLLGKNPNMFELEKDQLHSILLSPYAGYRSFEMRNSLCRRIFNTSRDVNCSGLHNFSTNYTFGKTETDNLIVRVEDMDTHVKRDIAVTINPHPYAVNLASECTSNDDLHEWACINAAPLIPDRRFTTTNAMRNSLPGNLARARSQYDLVAAVEFNSFDEMENMFNVTTRFRTSPYVRIMNGKLQLLINPVPTSDGKCVYSKHPSVNSGGVFEPNAGYLEYKVTKYPYIWALGGNAIFWSRYGSGHGGFALPVPNRVWRSNGRTSVTRSDIGRIGYAEIDLIERWYHRSSPYFVAHTYPQSSAALLGGLPIYNRIPAPRFYYPWSTGTSNDDTADANTYSITYGMEVSPGHSRAGRTLNFFQDGVRIDRASGYDILDYVNGGAFRIETISNIDILKKPCSTLRPTMIEMDHIRYYRPRNGY